MSDRAVGERKGIDASENTEARLPEAPEPKPTAQYEAKLNQVQLSQYF